MNTKVTTSFEKPGHPRDAAIAFEDDPFALHYHRPTKFWTTIGSQPVTAFSQLRRLGMAGRGNVTEIGG